MVGNVKVNGANLIALSSDDTRVAVSNIAGDISTFSLPNLHPIGSWTVNEQPLADEVSTDQKAVRSLNRHFSPELHRVPSALTWWNDSHLVISRISGSVSIHAVDSNLDPVTEAEWFQPFPLISNSHGGSILGLDCAMKTIGNEQTDDFFLENDESSMTLTSGAFSLAKRMMYYLTEIERFRPEDPPVEQVTVLKNFLKNFFQFSNFSNTFFRTLFSNTFFEHFFSNWDKRFNETFNFFELNKQPRSECICE